MTQKAWTDVENFIDETLIGEDPMLAATLAASKAAGLPSIAVAPNQGKFLQILARAIGSRRILEVGTLGGYSTIWLAAQIRMSASQIVAMP